MVQILDSAIGHVVVGAVQSSTPAHFGEVAYMLQRAFDLTVEVSMQLFTVYVGAWCALCDTEVQDPQTLHSGTAEQTCT